MPRSFGSRSPKEGQEGGGPLTPKTTGVRPIGFYIRKKTRRTREYKRKRRNHKNCYRQTWGIGGYATCRYIRGKSKIKITEREDKREEWRKKN